MSDLLERFETQLLAARPRRRRPARRSALAAGLVVLAVAAPTLAATEPWKPLLGDQRRGTPSASRDRPPADQLAGLGVLRRAQTSADRGALAQSALRLSDDNIDGIRTADVRLLTSPAIDAVLIPVKRFDLNASRFISPHASEQLKARMAPKPDGLCLYAPDPAGDGGGYGCSTWQQIKTGQMPSSIGPIVYGIVPDGVTQVTIHLAQGQRVDVPVHDNFYAHRATPRGHRHGRPATLAATWTDKNGSVIKTVRPPQPPTR
jgi:hypothetical protein